MMKANTLVRTLKATYPLIPQQAALYELIRAANGTFIRAKRDTFSLIAPLSAECCSEAAIIQPQFQLLVPKVPSSLLKQILTKSIANLDQEVLFYLIYNETMGWQLIEPPQIQTAQSVSTTSSPFSSYADIATIEIHSHHRMAAQFSLIDDLDESGFRLYGVLGSLPHYPTLRLRAGIYQQTFWEIPASWVWEMPPQIQDAVELELWN